MRAIVIKRPGGPEVLTLDQVNDPVPGKGEVLVRIHATGVNRADVMQRMGRYPSPPDSPPDIPGLEFAGVVAGLGPEADLYAVGDKVFGLAGGGTYADYVILHQRCLARIPANLSFVEAASIPEVFTTAYDAMISQCGLLSGETVLVHAVGSGVGLAVLQIAKLFGATVIGTARSEDKIEAARKYGLDNGFVVRDGKFAAQVKDITHGAGANLIVELVGGSYVAEDIHCAANKGRIIVVGLVAGLHAEIDFGLVLRKRLMLKGTTMRMRPLEEKIIAAQLLQNQIAPLFEKRLLKPTIDKVWTLADADQAHEYMDKNQNFGKIVLEISK
jgi:putative PIG3 family NAD(P)H quinone oxidoreductase